MVEYKINAKDFIISYIYPNDYHIVNFVSLFAKQFIYRNKCMQKNVNLGKMESELYYLQTTELCTARRNRKLKNHVKNGALRMRI